ncbi:hypothetical protein ACLI4Z_12775 [Natrialbaceae archaeon A-arb3/5]
MTTDADPQSPDSEAIPPVDCEHLVVENADAPDECVIVPYDPTEDELYSCWIVAHEGSFVTLESMR